MSRLPLYTRVRRHDQPALIGTVVDVRETIGHARIYEVRWDGHGASWHPPEHLVRLHPEAA